MPRIMLCMMQQYNRLCLPVGLRLDEVGRLGDFHLSGRGIDGQPMQLFNGDHVFSLIRATRSG